MGKMFSTENIKIWKEVRLKRLIKQGKMFSSKPKSKVGFKRIGHYENGKMSWGYKYERKKWTSSKESLVWNEGRERWEIKTCFNPLNDIFEDVKKHAGNIDEWAYENFRIGGKRDNGDLLPYHKINLHP